jgi:hypothetical protein
MSSLGDAKSSLGDAKSSLGDAKSSLGDAKSSLGDAMSSLGDAKSSLGDAKSSLGDAKSSMGDAIISQARAAVGAALLRAREGEGGGAGQRRPLCWRRLREEHALSWGELLSLPEVQRHMGHDAASPPPAHLFGKVGESPSHPHPRERERERERTWWAHPAAAETERDPSRGGRSSVQCAAILMRLVWV